jgi:hypothetical protein
MGGLYHFEDKSPLDGRIVIQSAANRGCKNRAGDQIVLDMPDNTSMAAFAMANRSGAKRLHAVALEDWP